MPRMTAKIIRPFMLNGKLLNVGDEVDMDADRAVRHMRAGDVERNEEAIKIYKDKEAAKAQARLKSISEW